jgi:hypothetical protein
VVKFLLWMLLLAVCWPVALLARMLGWRPARVAG